MSREWMGQIVVDECSEEFVCQGFRSEERRHIASVIRRLDPAARLRLVGGNLSMDLPTALKLRGANHRLHLKWTEEATRAVDTFAASYTRISKARQRIDELQTVDIAIAALADYDRRNALDRHQVIAVAAMADPLIRGLCLFDEQGTGKTVMTLHAFDLLRHRGAKSKMLIFSPKNMVQEWGKEFQRFFRNKYVVSIVAGTRAQKYDALHEQADVYVTNYETAHLLESPLRSLLSRNMGRAIIAVDESFFVKNRETKRGAAVRRLRHLCERCWVLCGTPAPNHALDVVHQFDIADGGVTFGGIPLPEQSADLRRVIQKAVEQRGVYLRRLKSEVLPGLPDKQFERVVVPMEKEQYELYRKTLEGLVNEVESIAEGDFKKKMTSFLARRMALFQLCSHPAQVEASYRETPGKLLALDGIVEELVRRRGEKIVIWSFFRYSLNQIVQRYAKFNPVRLDGTVVDTQARSEAINRFQGDDHTMLFVGNPAAAGAGITLTRARTAIYESFSIQAAHYLQSLDRIHRRGQERDVSYYMLLCKDSIEEDEYNRLLIKEQSARDLFRDNDPRPLSRDVFLGELLSAWRKL